MCIADILQDCALPALAANLVDKPGMTEAVRAKQQGGRQSGSQAASERLGEVRGTVGIEADRCTADPGGLPTTAAIAGTRHTIFPVFGDIVKFITLRYSP